MKSVTNKIFMTMAIVAALSGCAAGTPIDWDKARQVRTGMTTEEVTALMGRPYMVQHSAAGTKYIWAYGTAMGSSGSAAMTFVDNKLVEAPKVPNDF